MAAQRFGSQLTIGFAAVFIVIPNPRVLAGRQAVLSYLPDDQAA
jgi:hypothetical protein